MELRRGSLIIAGAGAASRRALRVRATEGFGGPRGWRLKKARCIPAAAVESQGLAGERMARRGKRNKRFYRLSKEARAILKQLIEEWQSMKFVAEKGLFREWWKDEKYHGHFGS